MCILSSSCANKTEPILNFHFRLSPLALPFGRRDPVSLVPPSVLQHQEFPGVQSFPACHVLLWFRRVNHGQVPQWILGYHLCREFHLCPVVQHNKVWAILNKEFYISIYFILFIYYFFLHTIISN